MERWRPSIPIVIDRLGHRWTPEEIEPDPSRFDRDGIRCAGCGVAATWQAAYTRTDPRTGQTVDVRLHFKLKHRHSEHGSSCPYDFDRRASDLVRDFPGVVRKRGEIYQALHNPGCSCGLKPPVSSKQRAM
ncbi:hypothetical protein CHO01_28770 [Cellulomonas hominis]|uniref:Uncharacterized protein n=1 Tax=Cellulomonas hominis TaxID=156981 RepID=A0A511FEU8_9CELL|nr:hypothetical protein CHO01_28770 [Cellulomonas hominis]